MNQAVVLCEGYHDRAFWRGWLLARHGLAGPAAGKPVLDPDGKPVGKGHYAYWTPSKNFIRVVPCGSDEHVLREMEIRLKGSATKSFNQLLVNLDSDNVDGKEVRNTRHAILDRAKKIDAGARLLRTRDISLSDGARVIPIIWETSDAGAHGIPRKQTLERLVCAAICAAHPTRGAVVTNWLATCNSSTDSADHKAHAWSMMAGWYADRGCDDFYSAVWEDATIRPELERRLAAYLDPVADVAA